MDRVKQFIRFLNDFYKKSNERQESTWNNSVDSFFEELEQEAAENRKRIADLGFRNEYGEYKEGLQEIFGNGSN